MGSKGSVLVAMSGGVDSSVSACLLVEQGYEVLGSHMNLVHLADGVDHGCCGPSARADAEAVARIGGVSFAARTRARTSRTCSTPWASASWPGPGSPSA